MIDLTWGNEKEKQRQFYEIITTRKESPFIELRKTRLEEGRINEALPYVFRDNCHTSRPKGHLTDIYKRLEFIGRVHIHK